jgi:hypothetical protein
VEEPKTQGQGRGAGETKGGRALESILYLYVHYQIKHKINYHELHQGKQRNSPETLKISYKKKQWRPPSKKKKERNSPETTRRIKGRQGIPPSAVKNPILPRKGCMIKRLYERMFGRPASNRIAYGQMKW